jgi:hypothetical protein
MLTKSKLADIVIDSYTGRQVYLPLEEKGPYIQARSSTVQYECRYGERWKTELALGILYDTDPSEGDWSKAHQQAHATNSLHNYIYGGISPQLDTIYNDVRKLTPDPNTPALVRLNSLLRQLS